MRAFPSSGEAISEAIFSVHLWGNPLDQSHVSCRLVSGAETLKMALGQHVFGAERLQAFSDAVFAIITTIMVSGPFSSQHSLGLGLAT